MIDTLRSPPPSLTPTTLPCAASLTLDEYIDHIRRAESAHAARGAALSAYSESEIAERWARTTIREVRP